jgi:Ca2+-binding EF-hand superfamily protein
MFLNLDQDGDGSLNLYEITLAIQKTGVFFEGMSDPSTIIAKVDKNGDGKISYSEFICATAEYSILMNRKNLEYAFR